MRRALICLVLLVGCVILATIATHLLPAGAFEREVIDGREMVVAGTFHSVEATPVGLFDAFVALRVA